MTMKVIMQSRENAVPGSNDGPQSGARAIAAAFSSLLAFANPAHRYPVANAQAITTKAWNNAGRSIQSASEQVDAKQRNAA
jgi:hypothetical protein